MATYVMIGKYAPEAMKGISAERTDEAIGLIEKCGGDLKSAYATLGESDLILIADFPDAQHAMQASLKLSVLTSIAFTTMPAVDVDTFDKLME